jgi:hypothetical protein
MSFLRKVKRLPRGIHSLFLLFSSCPRLLSQSGCISYFSPLLQLERVSSLDSVFLPTGEHLGSLEGLLVNVTLSRSSRTFNAYITLMPFGNTSGVVKTT